MFRISLVCLLLSSSTFAGDELLPSPTVSNIRQLVPNESANHPLGETLCPPCGFEVGRQGQIQSELLHEYNVSAYINFPAGVRVFEATYSTVVTTPSAAYQVYETSVNITNDSTWNNTPGPTVTIGAVLINVPASPTEFIEVQSSPLAALCQWAIDASATVKLVNRQNSSGTAVRMGFQQIRLKAYLRGDTDLNDHVNFTDFLIFRFYFDTDTSGLTQLERFQRGDYDGDGDVDFTDFLQLSANFDQRLLDNLLVMIRKTAH